MKLFELLRQAVLIPFILPLFTSCTAESESLFTNAECDPFSRSFNSGLSDSFPCANLIDGLN